MDERGGGGGGGQDLSQLARKENDAAVDLMPASAPYQSGRA